MITEIIPKAQVHPIEAASLELLPGYSFYPHFETSDSNLGASGIIVAIYVKEDLNADVINFDTVFDDHIWVEIPLANADRLLCGCIYRSSTKEKGAAERSTNQVE